MTQFRVVINSWGGEVCDGKWHKEASGVLTVFSFLTTVVGTCVLALQISLNHTYILCALFSCVVHYLHVHYLHSFLISQLRKKQSMWFFLLFILLFKLTLFIGLYCGWDDK